MAQGVDLTSGFLHRETPLFQCYLSTVPFLHSIVFVMYMLPV